MKKKLDPGIGEVIGGWHTPYALRHRSISKKDINEARQQLLKFSGEQLIDTTRSGQILRSFGKDAGIYINGVKAAEEHNFLFSYNITTLTAPIRKALSRGRSHVGRSAYADSVKKMLITSKHPKVTALLAKDVQNINKGTCHEEMKWLDVQVHAVRLLNATGRYLFATTKDVMEHPDMIEEATENKYTLIIIPDNLRSKLRGLKDVAGKPVADIHQFVRAYNDSFEFDFVKPSKLTPKEQEVFRRTTEILRFIGGKPPQVRAIKISNSMRKTFVRGQETLGLWDGGSRTIILSRKLLKSTREYAGILIHEALHAQYEVFDMSRDFEYLLTDTIGLVCEKALKK